MEKIQELVEDRRFSASKRKTAYYWVLFNWPMFVNKRDAEWQPASWDENRQSWVIIGSNQEIEFWQPCIIQVDEKPIRRMEQG